MKTVLSALAVIALAGAAVARPVVVSQPPDIGAGGFFSDGADGQFYGQLIADNFTLGSATSVTGVTFWGESEFFTNPDYTNMASFQLSIYADAGGIPGAVLYTNNFATAATSPTIVGSSFSGSNVYRQEVSFSSLGLAAGNYHISIGAVLVDGFDDAWVWDSAVAGFDGAISARFEPVSSGDWTNFTATGDVAFEINGSVPTPGAAGVLGMAGLVGIRRRR